MQDDHDGAIDDDRRAAVTTLSREELLTLADETLKKSARLVELASTREPAGSTLRNMDNAKRAAVVAKASDLACVATAYIRLAEALAVNR